MQSPDHAPQLRMIVRIAQMKLAGDPVLQTVEARDVIEMRAQPIVEKGYGPSADDGNRAA